MNSKDTEFSWLQLPAVMESLEKFKEFVLKEAERVSLPSKTYSKIELILEEVLLNIINYAYSPDEQGYIDIGCRTTRDNHFCIRVQDRGPLLIPWNRTHRSWRKILKNDKPPGTWKPEGFRYI